jgi:ParB family transcriptional regulator, chromosome partitioning protein
MYDVERIKQKNQVSEENIQQMEQVLSDENVSVGGKEFTTYNVPLKDILADPEFNCRGKISPIDVVDLVKDIKEKGLLSPVLIQPIRDDHFKYRVIAGHRRHMAFTVMERETIPAMIRDDLDDVSARIFNLSENLKRKDLSLYEEAMSLKNLFLAGLREDDIAARLNESRGWVQVRCLVLKLPKDIQLEVKAGFLKQTNIRDIYALRHDPEAQIELCKKIKDARLAGKNADIKNVKKYKKNRKKQRSSSEIQKLQDHVSQFFGNGLTTRCLAWANGNIDDITLIESLAVVADKLGVHYEKPEGNIL